MKEVKFEKVEKYKDVDFLLPIRKTNHSAGYDFTVIEDIVIPSHYSQLFNLLKGKFTSPDFLLRAADLNAIDILSEVAEAKTEINQEQKEKLIEALKIELPSIIEFLSRELTMDIEDVKALTKATETKLTLIPTGVKIQLNDNQKLELLVRSSSSLGAYLMMGNGVGIIDADYYNNEDNEGHMFFQIINMSPFNILLKKGDIIGQGIISTYDKTDDDTTESLRIGGLGSTTDAR